MQKRILVVDDDELSRDLLSEMFELEYDIVEAKNGADALNVLSISLGVVECVLLDLMMPTLDGLISRELGFAVGGTAHLGVVDTLLLDRILP